MLTMKFWQEDVEEDSDMPGSWVNEIIIPLEGLDIRDHLASKRKWFDQFSYLIAWTHKSIIKNQFHYSNVG